MVQIKLLKNWFYFDPQKLFLILLFDLEQVSFLLVKVHFWNQSNIQEPLFHILKKESLNTFTQMISNFLSQISRNSTGYDAHYSYFPNLTYSIVMILFMILLMIPMSLFNSVIQIWLLLNLLLVLLFYKRNIEKLHKYKWLQQ